MLIITCPSCKTTYKVNPEELDNGNRELLCNKCNHKWALSVSEDLPHNISGIDKNIATEIKKLSRDANNSASKKIEKISRDYLKDYTQGNKNISMEDGDDDLVDNDLEEVSSGGKNFLPDNKKGMAETIERTNHIIEKVNHSYYKMDLQNRPNDDVIKKGSHGGMLFASDDDLEIAKIKREKEREGGFAKDTKNEVFKNSSQYRTPIKRMAKIEGINTNFTSPEEIKKEDGYLERPSDTQVAHKEKDFLDNAINEDNKNNNSYLERPSDTQVANKEKDLLDNTINEDNKNNKNAEDNKKDNSNFMTSFYRDEDLSDQEDDGEYEESEYENSGFIGRICEWLPIQKLLSLLRVVFLFSPGLLFLGMTFFFVVAFVENLPIPRHLYGFFSRNAYFTLERFVLQSKVSEGSFALQISGVIANNSDKELSMPEWYTIVIVPHFGKSQRFVRRISTTHKKIAPHGYVSIRTNLHGLPMDITDVFVDIGDSKKTLCSG